MANESYTLSDAANVLGVSVPTLRRVVAQKRISAFRTPGGHLRITSESLSRYQSGTNSPTSREPSPVLTNRRERIEELALEAQEYRAKRELENLRREEPVEAERQEAEAEAREQAAAQRETELEIERERLRHGRIK